CDVAIQSSHSLFYGIAVRTRVGAPSAASADLSDPPADASYRERDVLDRRARRVLWRGLRCNHEPGHDAQRAGDRLCRGPLSAESGSSLACPPARDTAGGPGVASPATA